jgi:hypothetical protein
MSAALKNLDRWIFLMHQVHEASFYIRRAEELGHPHLFTSYEAILEFLAHFRSALNAYAKCFVSTGPGRIKLEDRTVFVDDNERLAKHGRLMELRHKYVSHSDSNEFESVKVIQKEEAVEVTLRLQYDISFPFDRLYELRDSIRFVEGHVVDRQRTHLGSIARELGKPVRILEGSGDQGSVDAETPAIPS